MINSRFFLCILVIGLVACFIGLVIFFEKHPYLYYRLLDTIGGFLASALIIFCSAISGFCNWLVRKLNGDHKTQDPEKKCFEELMKEMKTMSNAIQKLEVQANAPGRTHLVEEQEVRVLANSSSRQQNANGMNIDLYSAKSSSPPTTMEPSVAPPSKSCKEISFISYDQLVADPPDAFDELQRITKISESGGVQDVNSGTSGLNGQYYLNQRVL